MAKSLRGRKVFIDWSQNSNFKTTVGVYSLRAKAYKPFVSMPVTSTELRPALDAKDVSREILARAAREANIDSSLKFMAAYTLRAGI